MATGKSFQEVELPQQKTQDNGVLLPAVLSPNTITDSTATQLSAFKDAIRANKPWFESLLIKRGAILFRGFPVISPYDFKSVVEAFSFPELPYVGGGGPRTKVIDRVYTANESPPDKEIPFHHEMAYLPNPPAKIFFFCEEEPGAGGETPIVSSHIIYEKMKERHPDFVEKLEEHGLRYIRIAGDVDDPSSFSGGSWKSTYKTDDKNIAEERCGGSFFITNLTNSPTDRSRFYVFEIDRAAKQGSKLEWIGNSAKVISKPMAAIRFDEESARKTWFNSLAVTYNGPATNKIGTMNISVEMSNGDPVDDEAMKDFLKIMEEECVAIPWKKGDVLLVNNFLVLHGRRPLIKPPRRILASLCK